MNWKRSRRFLPAKGEVVIGLDFTEKGDNVFRLLCYYGQDDWRDEDSGESEFVPMYWSSIEVENAEFLRAGIDDGN